MPTTVQEIFAVADQLQAIGGEASCRSATSRYYYASMHEADAWLNKTPGMPSAGQALGGTHAILESKLRNLDPKAPQDQKIKGRTLAVRLSTMKARRVTCDYFLGASPSLSEFAQQQADAKQFIADCASLPS